MLNILLVVNKTSNNNTNLTYYKKIWGLSKKVAKSNGNSVILKQRKIKGKKKNTNGSCQNRKKGVWQLPFVFVIKYAVCNYFGIP